MTVVETQGFDDYRLIDSGSGRKLERFGAVIVDRPEPQALWRPRLDAARWQSAHAVFAGEGEDEAGKWRLDRAVPETWPLRVEGVMLLGRLGGFRHLGLFPEQLPHWQWMVDAIGRARGMLRPDEKPRVLNLFAYTGAASLIAARAGAEVVHVDASKKAIQWARENQTVSGLADAPIRWLLEDARKLVAREVRRGRSYHVLLVDPPKFGRGPGGEVWELFDHLPALLSDCVALLDQRVSHLVLTAYAIRASALSIGQLTSELIGDRTGALEVGELAIREESGARAVPTSLFARWSSEHVTG
ncbi:MAG: class I SAM-dependent methyltransferase [Hyphomicrobiaceae bacterium]|nr:class I SAM-dependent methyltransferase [Hyphomicrobiaceae bacterium]